MIMTSEQGPERLTTPVVNTYGAIKRTELDQDDDDDDDEELEGSRMFKRMSSPLLSFTEPVAARGSRSDDDSEEQRGFLLTARCTLRNTVTAALRFSGEACSVRDVQGSATVPVEVLNLVKNIVGAGALALPSGVAAFADAPAVLPAASTWLAAMGGIFAYYFLLIGRTCKITRAASYAEAWERTMGRTGSGWVALAVALKAGMGNLECSMILADSFRDLFETVGLSMSRTWALLIVTFSALLPLCMLKNLAVLAPFSGLGMLAMLFTAFAIAVRWADGSYAEGGQFLNQIGDDMKPSFGSTGLVGAVHLRVLVFVCMLSEAYIAHYNSPRCW
jgi:hypothetical protein